jgi:hypothetical protein
MVFSTYDLLYLMNAPLLVTSCSLLYLTFHLDLKVARKASVRLDRNVITTVRNINCLKYLSFLIACLIFKVPHLTVLDH